MDDKKKPLINYIIVTFVIIVILSICYYTLVVYDMHKKDALNSSIMGQYLNEIKINELNDYLLENEQVFLYICSSEIEKCRNFENNIKEKIENYNLREHILYLNIKDVKNEYSNQYITEIKKYINNFDEENIPQMVIYTSANIIEVKSIKIFDDIIQLLDKYEVNYVND